MPYKLDVGCRYLAHLDRRSTEQQQQRSLRMMNVEPANENPGVLPVHLQKVLSLENSGPRSPLRDLKNRPLPINTEMSVMQSAPSAELNTSEAGPITADEDFNEEEWKLRRRNSLQDFPSLQSNTPSKLKGFRNLKVFQEPATFDFDSLSKGGKSKLDPKFVRQSLYVKFDPLVEKALAAKEETCSPLPSNTMASGQSSSDEGKGDAAVTQKDDERLIQVTPVTIKKTGDRQSSGSHTPSLRQEISKLQELMIQQEQAHQEKADLVEELRQRIAELEASEPVSSTKLQEQLSEKDKEVAKLQKELDEAKISNKQLVQVMEEYEKTISQLVTIKEETKAQYEKEKEVIAAERDTALQHLSNMEVAFNDVHQKYERAKGVIETFHANELALKKNNDALAETLNKQKEGYLKFKAHAAETLQAANNELERKEREITRMNVIAKKNELKCKSLEESLAQKEKDLRELTQICDELIANHCPPKS